MDRKNETVIDLWKVFRIFWKRLWILLLAAFIGAGIAFFYTRSFVTPRYRTNADLYVNSTASLGSGVELSVSSSMIQSSRSLIDTYSVIMKSHLMLEEVIKRLDLPYSYGQLYGMVSASDVNGTEILRLTVTSNDPEEARLIANTIVDVLPEQIAKIIHGSSVEVIDLAVTPSSPYFPSYSNNVTKGFMVGLLISMALVFLVEYLLHDTIEDTEWLKSEFGEKVPVLAMIPDTNSKHKSGRYGKYNKYYRDKYYSSSGKNDKDLDKTNTNEKSGGKFIIDDGVDFITTESYNRLRSNLEFACPVKQDGGRIIGVTSANPHEGKSFSAINLAYTFAKSGYRVLIVDGDMRCSTIAEKLGLPVAPGLSNILVNQTANAVHQSVGHPNLSVITAGDIPPNPSELLSSNSIRRLLKFFSEKFDIVIVDLPPVNTVIDPVAVSDALDGMLVVVRHSDTKRRELLDAMQQLEFSNTNLLGFIYNGYGSNRGYYSRSSGKYKYYKYGYHNYQSHAQPGGDTQDSPVGEDSSI